MAAPWEKYGGQTTAPPPQTGGFTGYIPASPKPRNPLEDTRDRLAIEKTTADLERMPTQAAKDQTDLVNADFKARTQGTDRNLDNSIKIKNDFQSEQAVKDYNSSLAIYGKALSATPDPQGDLALVYAFAKMMDPGSVVRESETAMAQSTSPVVQQIWARFGKELAGGGSLSPDARAGLKREIANSMASFNNAFIGKRVQYKQQAERFGLNPLDVVGEHPGIRFQKQEAAFLGRPVPQADYEGNVIAPATAVPTASGGGDEPTAPDGEYQFSDAQTKQTANFLATNPSPEQLQAFIRALSNGQSEMTSDVAKNTLDQIRKGAKWGGFSYNWEKAQREQIDQIAKERDNVGGAIDATVRGAADVASLGFADEIAARLDASLGNGSYQENLNKQRMIDKADEQANPWSRTGGQVAGGFLIPMGKIGSVSQAAGKGAVAGALYGAGSAEGGVSDRAMGALQGGAAGATGGALGYGAAKGIEKAAPYVGGALDAVKARFPKAQSALDMQAERVAVRQAAERQGVDLLPADVGGQGIKALTSAAGQAPLSAGSVSGVARRASDQMSDATGRAASGAGKSLPVEQAGEIIRKGGKDYIEKTRQNASRLYDKAHAQAKGVRIKPLEANKLIDDKIAKLSELKETNGPLIKSLQKLKADLSGGVSVSGMRDARTSLSQGVFDGKLRSGQEKTMYKEVIDALSGDIERGLQSTGKTAAAGMFKRADALWRDRINDIDQVLEPIIGNTKSGEDIVAAVEAMTRGNKGGVQRLGGLMRTLPDKERGDITATIIERLGKATASAQNDAGDVFSPETYLTNWNKMTPASKSVIFVDKALRQNLDDIAKVASAKRDTNKLASKSNTPAGLAGNVVLGGGAGYMAGGIPGLVLTNAAQYGAGKLLSAKWFANWLARSPKSNNPAAISAHIDRLKSVAAREPAMSAEIIQISDFLKRSVSETGKMAAAEDEKNGRIPPPQ